MTTTMMPPATMLAAGLLEPGEVTTFLLSLAVLLGFARLLGELARQWRQPAVLGEICAGVLLGPTVFDYLSPTMYEQLFPAAGPVAVSLEGFITIAVAFLLLVAGLEVDLSNVWRQGKAAVLVSITGIVFPFAIGASLALMAPQLLGMEPGAQHVPFAMFVGIAMSITALPVIAKILMDLNLFKSDMGMLVMSSAMVNDLVGWIGFAFILAAVQGGEGSGSLGLAGSLVGTLVFAVGMLTLGRWLAHRALPFVQAHTVWPGGVLGFVLTIALVCAAVTEWIGVHAIFGAFIAGVAIGDSSHLRERTRDTVYQFVINIFAPVFFASIGLRVNFIDNFDLLLVVVVVVIALIGKVLGCYLGAIWAGLSRRESWATGFGMSARGAMEIILGQLALSAGLITTELFVAIVIMALVTSLIAGPAMQAVLRTPHRRRLKDLLNDRQIITKPKAVTLEAMLREMSDLAAAATNQSADAIYNAVLARERFMRTGLPDGLAVPHARLNGLAKPCVILVRHPDGIDFDAPDGQLARIICLLLTPADQPDAQIELLDTFVRTFADQETRHRVLEAGGTVELLAALNQAGDTHEVSDNGASKSEADA